MSDELLDLIESAVPRPSARALERGVLTLIADGRIPSATRLPSARRVAERLDVSPAAVGQAWRALVRAGAAVSRTKGGTVVIGPPRRLGAERLRNMSRPHAHRGTHSQDVPFADRDLLPDLSAAVRFALESPDIQSAGESPITPALRTAVETTWPVGEADFLATHGAVEGVELALRMLVKPGSRVAVENPTNPRVLDLLESAGVIVSPVNWTADGPDLAELEAAFVAGAHAFLFQPSTQTPTGRSVSEGWTASAADIIRGHDATVIEFVPFPFLAHPQMHSLTDHAAERVVRVSGYELAHGPDMRVAVVGGPPQLISPLVSAFEFSSRWVSRVLQNALAFQLVDPASQAIVRRAGRIYRERAARLADALERAGLVVESVGGAKVWIAVNDEEWVAARLAGDPAVHAHVHAGLSYRSGRRGNHLAIHGGTVAEGYDELAARVSEVNNEAGSTRREHRRADRARPDS